MRAVRKSAKENPSLEEAIGKDSDFIYICNTIVFNKDTILSKSYGNPIIENNIAFRSKKTIFLKKKKKNNNNKKIE